MRETSRSALAGLILLNATAVGSAQEVAVSRSGGESGAAGGFAIVGGFTHSNNIYQPGRSSVALPYMGMSMWGQQGPMPIGQAGPGGLSLPHPPAMTARPRSTAVTTTNRRADHTRSEELTEVGDRSFRGGNLRRAEERYQLAVKANPESPTPHIHLAQVAASRGDYTLAAGQIRNAVASARGPGWLLEARDIQSMYGEPADFSRRMSHLESHLQTHPGDRNAWFVLGAQQFLSGNPQAASDTFLRLTDRAADEALTAFLDAATVATRTLAHQ